jgi:formamidopyrimidine-DNA glycosylase
LPELPEVETVRAGLEPLVSGATIDAVTVFRDSCVRHQGGGAAEFAMELTGTTLGAVVRRGKFLWFLLDDGDGRGLALSAHLGMSGQFRSFAGEAPAAHTHCRVRLELTRAHGALTLDFLDQRTFGYLHVEPLVHTADGGPGGQGSPAPFLPRSVAHIARDALDPAAGEAVAENALRKGTRAIKSVLLDQTAVSGIGNIYADEALWSAAIHPLRTADSLTPAEASRLLASARAVMSRALAQGGTSFDALYVNVNGESGYFSRDLAAYGRAGEPCPRCGEPITKSTIGGRSSHWCPRCQWVENPGTDQD